MPDRAFAFTCFVASTAVIAASCASPEHVAETDGSGDDGSWRVPRHLHAVPPAADDCDACARSRCGALMDACEGPCASAYEGLADCIFPVGGGWSGFSTQACGRRVSDAIGSEGTAAALGVLTCITSSCGGPSGCGTEPRAIFAQPSAASGADFSAAEFLERYCNGCHNPAFVPPPGKVVTSFSLSWTWQAPFSDPSWMAEMDYTAVAGRGDVIACGVNPFDLPPGCAWLSTVDPGFFTGAEKFPPKAPTKPASYGSQGEPMCPFSTDGAYCAQPSSYERARMVSWVADGMPEY